MSPEELNELLGAAQREYEKRFFICARCDQNTQNTTQGHYWAYCKVTKTTRDFHMCCPGDCELEENNERTD
jgi:hypothetical protein